MGVLVEAITIVVPSVVLDAKYPGGRAAYAEDAPNRTYCTDGYLSAVRFMVPRDAEAFVERLRQNGLVFHDGQSFIEIAVIDQFTGPSATTDWLLCGRSEAAYTVAWLKGTQPFPMAHPAAWTPEQSRQLQFVAPGNEEGYLALRRKGTVDILLDFATGKEVYVGRTTDTPL